MVIVDGDLLLIWHFEYNGAQSSSSRSPAWAPSPLAWRSRTRWAGRTRSSMTW